MNVRVYTCVCMRACVHVWEVVFHYGMPMSFLFPLICQQYFFHCIFHVLRADMNCIMVYFYNSIFHVVCAGVNIMVHFYYIEHHVLLLKCFPCSACRHKQHHGVLL